MSSTATLQCFRGNIVHCLADPGTVGAGAVEHIPDGLLVVEGGRVRELGPCAETLQRLPEGTPVRDYSGHYIVPGFIDTHNHYSQTDMIASHGVDLLDWLKNHTFPTEAAFEQRDHADRVADFYCDELLRNGTTTAMSFATVHPHSVDALFEAARKRNMRLIAGKVLMDRNCPENLREEAEIGAMQTRRLIEKWHGRERLLYAISPRFAPTSTVKQMQLTGELFDTFPGIYLQSHLAESRREVDWVQGLYPWARSYLDVYDQFSQLGPRAVYAHCLWMTESDCQRMAETGTAISFCPTSNLFLGSGLFDLERARRLDIRVGLGTDVGGGTSFSLLRTLGEAYKVLKLNGQDLSPEQAFHLITLGSAQSLYLEHCLGNFTAGKEADFVVLDPHATPLMARRAERARCLSDILFMFMTLGDDRSILASHIMGERAWHRARP